MNDVALTFDIIYIRTIPFLFYVNFYNIIVKNFNIYDNQMYMTSFLFV